MSTVGKHLQEEAAAIPEALETAETTKLDLVPEVDSKRREILDSLLEHAPVRHAWIDDELSS